MVEQEKGCWSFNVASAYADAVKRWSVYLEEASEHLKCNRIPQAQESMIRAHKCMIEANTWYNQANNQMFRIEALVAEIKMLRRGTAVTYVEGYDPIDDNWRVGR